MLTDEQVVIRDDMMHSEDTAFSSTEVGGQFIDFFVNDTYIYQRIYNNDRTEFTEYMYIK